MIKKVYVENFNGQSREINLTSKDVLQGGNGAGKTTILKAIEFAFLGSVGDKKRINDIFYKFGTAGTTMMVKVETSDFEISRIVSESGQQAQVIGDTINITGVKKCNDFLAKYSFEMPFNFDDFVRAKDSDKKDLLVKLMGQLDISQENISTIIEDYAAMADTLDNTEFAKELRATHTNSIDNALKYAEKERKFYNRDKKNKQGSIVELTKNQSEMQGNISKLPGLREQLKEVEDTISDLQIETISIERIQNQRNSIKASIENKKQMIDTVKDTNYSNKLKELTEEKERLQKKANLIHEEPTKDLVKEAEKELEFARKNYKELKEEINANSLYYQQWVKEKKLLEDLKNGIVICPLTEIKCPVAAGTKDENIEKIITTLEKRVKEDAHLDELIETLNEKEMNILGKMSDIDDTITKLTEDYTVEYAKYQEHMSDVKHYKQEVERLSKEIESFKELQEGKMSKIQGLEKEIESLEEDIRNLPATKDPEVLASILDGKKVQADELKEKITKLEKLQQVLELRSVSVDSYNESVNKYDTWNDIVKDLRTLKTDSLQRQLFPIKEIADRILNKMGYDKEFGWDFEDRFEFGFLENGRLVTNLSNGEMIIASIAILFALQRINTKYSFLFIDEINILDQENLKKLLQLELEFDNIILVSPYEIAESNTFTSVNM